MVGAILRLRHRIIYFLDLHSKGQEVLSPYNWSKRLPRNSDDQVKACVVFRDAVRAFTGTQYKAGPAAVVSCEQPFSQVTLFPLETEEFEMSTLLRL